jgi:aryl-alcohol dehydrogenase-like predicted oxidoreductase
MQYRQLGRSGLKVSALSLGTMTFGGKGLFKNLGTTDVAGARRLIDIATDHGVNLLDTANFYSWGLSEEIIGEAIEGKRDQLLLASKVRMPMSDGPNDTGLSRHHIIREVEASLRRLRTDYIDLYQVHGWDGQTPLEETMEALDTLVRSGKVRYIGCSNYSCWHISKALGVAERHNYQRFVSQQIHYSPRTREPEYELVPIALDQGLGILVWSPLGGGLLTGKFRRGMPEPEGARWTGGWDEPRVNDEKKLYDIIEVLVEIGESRAVSAAQIALAWELGRPGITSLIVGATREEQLLDNLAAADLVLTSEERQRIDDVSAPPLIYPYWHQAKSAKDRLNDIDLTLIGPHLKK